MKENTQKEKIFNGKAKGYSEKVYEWEYKNGN